jgi:Domain of unknown function (DUF4440)
MNAPVTRLDPESALAADQARRNAMAADDLEGLAALLADECLYVHSTGAVDTKQSYLAKLADGSIRYAWRRCSARCCAPACGPSMSW